MLEGQAHIFVAKREAKPKKGKNQDPAANKGDEAGNKENETPNVDGSKPTEGEAITEGENANPDAANEDKLEEQDEEKKEGGKHLHPFQR